MVNVLWVKLLRELWGRKGALLSLAAIAAMGVAFYTGLASLMRDLDGARARFYNRCQLADFSCTFKRAPAWAIERVRQLPNLRAAEGRVNLSVRLQLPGEPAPLLGTALTLPRGINQVVVRRGTGFTGRQAQEALINDAFARARGIVPGQRLQVVIEGYSYSVVVVGTVMSPEFVYVIPAGGLAPDPARTPVLWMPERFLQEAGGMDGAYNEVVGMLHDPSAAATRDTLRLIERRLDAYGVLLTVPQDEQVSVHFLANELTELRVNSVFLPSICMGVVALVLQVVMTRTVAAQRTVVGTLRALGYTSWELWQHYLGYGWAVGLAGAVMGCWLGTLLQWSFLGLYRQFFELPDMVGHLYPSVLLTGSGICLFFALAGSALGVRKPVRLAPADAMRPPPPEQGHRIVLEKLPWLWERLGFEARLVLRSVFRNPMRSLITFSATMIATALVVETLCMFNSVEFLVDFSFRRTAHQDLTVSLREGQSWRAGREVQGLGTGLVEGQLVVTCDLSNGAARKRIGISGLPSDSRLQTPIDLHGQPVRVPASGLLLARKLAEMLHVKPGQTVRMRPLLGKRREVEVPVSGVVDTYLGLSAYANRDYLSRRIGEERTVNSLLVSTHHGPPSLDLLHQLGRRPKVLGVEQRALSLKQIRETLDKSISTSLGILILFSGSLAFGSVLNTALVSLGERQREVGTLRVLGYTPWEVWRVFAAESYSLNGLGILLGLPAGVAFAHLISQAYNTELFRLPVVVTPLTLLAAALILLFFVTLAQLVTLHLVMRMPWLEVFKVRE